MTEGRLDRIFQSIKTIFARSHSSLYCYAFNLWVDLCKSTSFEFSDEMTKFIFKNLMPELFHVNEAIRKSAQRALSTTIPLLLSMDYRKDPDYVGYKTDIFDMYAVKLRDGLKEMPEWHLIWCDLFTIIQKDVARSLSINPFLSVVEHGFRSTAEDQAKSFHCWLHLIKFFKQEGQLEQKKRVKLIGMPLSATPARNLELAVSKFRCWWYLICHVGNEMCRDPKICLDPFLVFCFGPLTHVPLNSYTNQSIAVSPGKLYGEMNMAVVLALILLMGQLDEDLEVLRTKTIVDAYDKKIDLSGILPQCRQRLVHCCGEATVLMAHLELTVDMQLRIVTNIWRNLFELTKSEGTLRSFELIIEMISALIQLSNNEVHAEIKPTIGHVFRSLIQTPIYPFGIRGEGFVVVQQAAFQLMDVLQQTDQSMLDEASFTNVLDTLILPPYKAIILAENRLKFVSELCSAYVKVEVGPRNFEVWKYAWINMVRDLNVADDFQFDFLKNSLGLHFEVMLKERGSWIRCTSKNGNINRVAAVFDAIASNIAVSAEMIDVIDTFFGQIDYTFDKAAAPTEIFVMFINLLKRIEDQKYFETSLKYLITTMNKLRPEQFMALELSIVEILKIVKKFCSQASDVQYVEEFKRKCRSNKTLVIMAQHQDWLNDCPALAPPPPPPPPVPAVPAPHPTKSSSQKKADDEFVPIASEWSFNPKSLTEHQTEKLKTRRDDIPALYNDNSQSQDSHSLQLWPTGGKKHRVKELSNLRIDIVEGDKFGLFSDGPTLTRNKIKEKEQPRKVSARRMTIADPTMQENVHKKTSPRKKIIEELKNKVSKKERNSTDKNKKETHKKDLTKSMTKVSAPDSSLEKSKKSERSNKLLTKSMVNESTISNSEEKKKTEKKSNPERVGNETGKSKNKDSKNAEKIKNTVDVVAAQSTTPEVTTSSTSKASDNLSKDDAKTDAVVEEAPLTTVKVEKMSPVIASMISIPKKVVDMVTEMTIELPVTAQPAECAVIADVAPIPMEVEFMDGTEIPLELAREVNAEAIAPRSISSSPEMEDEGERESTFLNDTLNISPILKDKSTNVASAATQSGAGDAVTEKQKQQPSEILTTPKRSADVPVKENSSAAINTTPHPSFLSRLNGRGAQMLSLNQQQTSKQFLESTPKDKVVKEVPQSNLTSSATLSTALASGAESKGPSKESDAIQRMMTRTVPSNKVASPSISILRRKRMDESLEDLSESPAAKKKKVSFTDPPVSATKEFQRDLDGTKQMRPMASFKSKLDRLLPRKSKTDSASEIRELKIGESGLEDISDTDSDLEAMEEDGTGTGSTSKTNDSALIRYLSKKYVPVKVADPDQQPTTPSVAPPKLSLSQCEMLTDILLQNIGQTPAVKEMFYQKLLYKYPKDSLEWAIRENSGYAACEVIPTASFNSYMINRLKKEPEYEQQLCRDIHTRLDPEQKINLFVRAFGQQPPNNNSM